MAREQREAALTQTAELVSCLVNEMKEAMASAEGRERYAFPLGAALMACLRDANGT